MKKNRLILYSTFGFLLLFIFFFSLYMDSNSENIALLLRLQGKIWMLKWCSLMLLIMFITNVILHMRDNKRNQRINDSQVKDITELKAKLYDKGISKTSEMPTEPTAPKSEKTE